MMQLRPFTSFASTKYLTSSHVTSCLLAALLLAPPPSVAEGTMNEKIEAYIRDFNRSVPANELVANYWTDKAVILDDEASIHLDSKEEISAWLGALQNQIESSGWIRSELLEQENCQISSNVALSSLVYRRIFDDGRASIVAGTYTMVKDESWRISALTFIQPDALISCD